MTSATTELLQTLIRNECVNDGTDDSGQESRSADTLATLFHSHSDVEQHAHISGRNNIVVRVEGSDPEAPSLLLLGHTDVVPATAADWDFDPFGGEIADGFVQGRGAVDMLNLTSSMAVATSSFIASGVQPKGTIIFAGVADEEAGGGHGAEYLLREHPEIINADYVLTESGGIQMPHEGTTYLPVVVGEKGVHWVNLDVEGTPSHGSKPYGTDNAVITASEIIHRITNYSPTPAFSGEWETLLNAMGIDSDLVQRLNDPSQIDAALSDMETQQASLVHACCHTTMSPNMIHGGSKVNTVADHVRVKVDMRSLPGVGVSEVERILVDVLGDLSSRVSISYDQNEESSISSTDTELWSTLQKVSTGLIGDAELIPMIAPYGTDARFFRRNNAVAYGFGLFSPVISFDEHISMFHGRNERVDIESLDLSTQMFEEVIKEFAQ